MFASISSNLLSHASTMKPSAARKAAPAIIVLLSCAFAADGFSVVPRSCATASRTTTTTTRRRQADAAVVEQEDATETVVGVYDRLGIERGNLALGVKPDEVLKYIGTREDLIQKTLTDIPKLDRSQAETEVDKFLMDAEMIDLYIRFGKELEKDPDFVVPDTEPKEEGLFSLRTVLLAYIGYIGFGIVSKLFRNYVADQEIAGTWEGTKIGFIDEWIQNTSSEATQQALQRAAAAAGTAVEETLGNVASSLPDGSVGAATSSALGTAGTAVDAVQSAVVEAVAQTSLFLM